jgi:hypothetical protein
LNFEFFTEKELVFLENSSCLDFFLLNLFDKTVELLGSLVSFLTLKGGEN